MRNQYAKHIFSSPQKAYTHAIQKITISLNHSKTLKNSSEEINIPLNYSFNKSFAKSTVNRNISPNFHRTIISILIL